MRVEGAAHLRRVARDLALVLIALVGHRVADLAVCEPEGSEVGLRVGLPLGRKAIVKYESYPSDSYLHKLPNSL